MSVYSTFMSDINNRIAKMRYWDVAALKTCVFLFTLFLVKLWPPIAVLDWRWYLGLSFVVAVPMLWHIFERQWMRWGYVAVYGAVYLAVEFLTLP